MEDAEGEVNLVTQKLALLAAIATAPALALMQAAGTADLTWIGQIQQTGLYGVLIIAVVVLWRQLAKKEEQSERKDAQILLMVEHATQNATLHAESNRELRKVIEEGVHVKEELKASIDRLSQVLEDRPCLLPAESPKGRR